MKKSFYSFLFLFIGILTCQNIKAQDVTAIYNADFTNHSFNFWTPEGDYADQELWTVSDGLLTAYAGMAEGPCTSYLVSPTIKLGIKNNTVSFSYQCFYFTDITKEAQLVVREEGGEWTNVTMNYPPADDYSVFNTGEMPVPEEFNGKDVQFAFKYSVSTVYNIGYWYIQDFNLLGVPAENPSEKAEAGISFDVTEVTCTVGDTDFKAPVLNNPNNLKVYYSSENESVAIIEEDGSLIINGPGKAVIRALTLETDKFKKGEASYILSVVDPSIVFMADFDLDECGFVEESAVENTAWMRFWEGSMKADGYEKVVEKTPFYLVSPAFTLDVSGNTVSFDHKGDYFLDWEGEAQLVIREVGGEWVQIKGLVYPTSGTKFVSSGVLNIPSEFNGKEVQIAFMYAADGGFDSGIWYVDNLIVKRVEVPTGIEVISQERQDNKIYDLQGRRVNNPNKGIYIVNGRKIVIK